MNRSHHSSPLARVGPYELTAKVGAGGMGSVYRAKDSRDGRIVALKLMHEHVASDPSYAERFRREAAMAALIDSPNVVRVLEFASDQGRPYIVTEFVDGPAVDALVKQGPLAPEAAAAIAAGVAHALGEASRRNIVHRDIKPGNILIAPDGTPKVTDFGIATLDQASSLTLPGAFIGTAAYAAPEQHHGVADVRSDLYSLGVVLFEMLSGTLPFQAETATGMMRQHAEAPVPFERLAGTPDALLAVLRRCLEKDPARRYQQPSEAVAALAGLQPRHEEPPTAVPSNSDETVIGPVAVPMVADPGATSIDPDPMRATGAYPVADGVALAGWKQKLAEVPVLRRAALAGAAVAAVTVGIMVGFSGSSASDPGYSPGGGGGGIDPIIEVAPEETPVVIPTFEAPSQTPPPLKTATPEPTPTQLPPTPIPTTTQPAPPPPAPRPALAVTTYAMCHLDGCPNGSADLYAGYAIAVGFQLNQATNLPVSVDVYFDGVFYYTSEFTGSSSGLYFDVLPHANYSGELTLDVFVGGEYVDTLWGWIN